jgi:hypothetical protein
MMARTLLLVLVAGCVDSVEIPPEPLTTITVIGDRTSLTITGCHSADWFHDPRCDGSNVEMSIVVGGVPMLVPAAEGSTSYIDYPPTGYDHRLEISGDGVTQLVATYGSDTVIIDHIGVSLSNPIPTDTGAVAFTYHPVPDESALVYLDTWCRAPSSQWDASIVRPGVIELSDIQTRSFNQLMPCAYRLTIVQGVLQTDESRKIATWAQTQDSKTVLLRALSDPSSP